MYRAKRSNEADNTEIRKKVTVPKKLTKALVIIPNNAPTSAPTNARFQWLVRLPAAAPATMATRTQRNVQIAALT